MDTEGDRGYQRWAGIHGLPLPIYGQHGTASFLPWNRIYLLRFEEALRGFEPGVVLPWWDWTASDAIPAAFAAKEVDGRPNPLYGSRIDVNRSGESTEANPSETSREPGSSDWLPGGALVDEALESSGFDEFAGRLEQIHNGLHVWLGGTHATIAYAFYDPFCWVYQASVDRIWWLWQDRHPNAALDDVLGKRELKPFEMTVAEVWGAARLGYAYAESHAGTTSVFLAGASGDRPSTADQLNFSDYAQAFAEIIASEDTTPPLTIGIYGSWGIGKSSLLEMIADQFEEPDAGATTVYVVDFNAWEYNSSEAIWPALVRRVMEEMERRSHWGKGARLWDTLKRNADREWRRRRTPLAVAFVLSLLMAVLVAVELEFDSS